jgi:hypothetical protein
MRVGGIRVRRRLYQTAIKRVFLVHVRMYLYTHVLIQFKRSVHTRS